MCEMICHCSPAPSPSSRRLSHHSQFESESDLLQRSGKLTNVFTGFLTPLAQVEEV